MTPENRLDLDVQVRVDGTWWPGTLRHWRQREGVGEGWVLWSTGVGQNRIGWFDYAQLRQI